MKITINDFPHRKLDYRTWHEASGSYETHEGTWVIMASDMKEHMPPVLLTKFNEWMSGQTIMAIGGEAGYYLHDVERFLEGKGVID